MVDRAALDRRRREHLAARRRPPRRSTRRAGRAPLRLSSTALQTRSMTCTARRLPLRPGWARWTGTLVGADGDAVRGRARRGAARRRRGARAPARSAARSPPTSARTLDVDAADGACARPPRRRRGRRDASPRLRAKRSATGAIDAVTGASSAIVDESAVEARLDRAASASARSAGPSARSRDVRLELQRASSSSPARSVQVTRELREQARRTKWRPSAQSISVSSPRA